MLIAHIHTCQNWLSERVLAHRQNIVGVNGLLALANEIH